MLTYLNMTEIQDEKKKERKEERKNTRKNKRMQERKKERKNRQTDRLTNIQMTDRLTKPFKSSQFPKMFLRTNNQEQTSRLEIGELNLIFLKTGTGKLRSLFVT
jgi:hypothetical protein